MKTFLKYWIPSVWMVGIATLLAFLLSASGCATVAKDFTASTTASYTPGGQVYYQSTKNQENFHAKIELDADGKVKSLDVSTTATTPEAAIAAALSSQAAAMKAFTDLVNMVAPLISKGLVAAPIPVK